jgi:hypothetical protein
MILSKLITKDVGPTHAALIVYVLLISALSGRQLATDGVNFVVQSLLDPFWYPGDQHTARRLFAIAWTTTPARAIGVLFPSQIQLASFLFGLAAYSQIAVPLIVIINSRISGGTKSVVIILCVSATCFLANAAATELLFALSLTTIFVVFALDPARDPRMHRRIAISLLLLASYEVVAISNIILAIGTCISARNAPAMTTKYYVLAGLLSLALPFQIVCLLLESTTPGQGVLQWFVLAIGAVFVTVLLIGAMYFKSVGNSYLLRTGAVFICFAIPISVLLIPDLIGLRTREFHFAYPSRIYSAGVTLLIAALPVILNRDLVLWPSRVLDYVGARALRDLSFATLAAFCGVSFVASSDAYFYRVRLDEELSLLSGFVSTDSCSFCIEPTKFGYPDLSYPAIMPVYSMAHTLRHPELPPIVVFSQGDIGGYVSREQIGLFMASQLALRTKEPTQANSSAHTRPWLGQATQQEKAD